MGLSNECSWVQTVWSTRLVIVLVSGGSARCWGVRAQPLSAHLAVSSALLVCLPSPSPAVQGFYQGLRRDTGVEKRHVPFPAGEYAGKELLELKCCNSLTAIIQFILWALLQSLLGKGVVLPTLLFFCRRTNCNLISINCLVLDSSVTIT